MMLCRYARMKRRYPIGLFSLLALLAACTKVPEPVEGPWQPPQKRKTAAAVIRQPYKLK